MEEAPLFACVEPEVHFKSDASLFVCGDPDGGATTRHAFHHLLRVISSHFPPFVLTFSPLLHGKTGSPSPSPFQSSLLAAINDARFLPGWLPGKKETLLSVSPQRHTS